MTAAIFPAYALARLVVSRPYALFAAVGAAAAPALSYSPFLVEEPLAYPVSTLALLLIARAGLAPTPLVDRPRARRLLPRRARPRRSSRSSSPCSALVLLARELAHGAAAALARRAGPRRLGRAAARSCRRGIVRQLGGDRPPLEHVVPRRPGSSRTACSSTGSGRSGRSRSESASCRSSRARGTRAPREANRATSRSTTFVVVWRRGDPGFRLLHGGQGGVPVDDVRGRGRRAQPDLPRPARSSSARRWCSSDGGSLSSRRRPRRLRVYLVDDDAVLRSPSTRTTRRMGSRSRRFANRILRWPRRHGSRRRSSSSRSARGLVLVALGARARRRPPRSRRRVIAVFALAWSLTTEIYAANGERRASDRVYAACRSRRLGRPDDRRRADAVRRPGAQRPERHLAARVLEPVDQVVLGDGRQRAGPGAGRRRTSCAGRHARPRRPRGRVTSSRSTASQIAAPEA